MPDGLARTILAITIPAAIFGLAAGVSFLITRNRRLVRLEVSDGCTVPAGIVPVTAVLCLLFSSVTCYALFFSAAGQDPDQIAPLWGLFVGFGVGGVFMVLMSGLRWRWDAEGLKFQGTIGSVTMRWSEIEKFGLSWGSWCARGRDGRKVYWTDQYTIGGDVITAAVARYRPDLME